MRLLKLLMILLVCAVTVPSFAGPLEDAGAAYDKGDYATALRLLRPLAEQGNAQAQTTSVPCMPKARAYSRTM